MAIDAEAKKILKDGPWAATGDKVDPEDDTPAITRKIGYPASFSSANGDVPTREGMNGIFNQLESAAKAALELGCQPYDATVDWGVGAMVQYQGKIYCASVANGPSTTVRTPGGAGWDTMPGATTIPEAPSGLTFVNATPGQLTLRWTPPKDGGEAILEYQIQNAAGTTFTPTPANYPEIIIPNLTNGTSQTYKVRARNSKGWGPFSATASGQATAAAPGGGTELCLHVTGGDASAELHWLEPELNGSTISEWIIQWKSGSQSYTTSRQAILTDATARKYTVTGLTNGTEYEFRMRARTGAGLGGWSLTRSATPAAPPVTKTVPDKAQISRTAVGEDSLTYFVWTANSNGSAVKRGKLRYRPTPYTGAWTEVLGATAGVGTYNIKITGLSNTVYDVQGSIENETGWSPWSFGSSYGPQAQTGGAPAAPVLSSSAYTVDEVADDNVAHQVDYVTRAIVGVDPHTTGGAPSEIQWQTQNHSTTTPTWSGSASSWSSSVWRQIISAKATGSLTRRSVRARVKNDDGTSGWSNVITVTPGGSGQSVVPGKVSWVKIMGGVALHGSAPTDSNVYQSSKVFMEWGEASTGGYATSWQVRWFFNDKYNNVNDVEYLWQVRHTATYGNIAWVNGEPLSLIGSNVRLQIRGHNSAGYGAWQTLVTYSDGTAWVFVPGIIRYNI